MIHQGLTDPREVRAYLAEVRRNGSTWPEPLDMLSTSLLRRSWHETEVIGLSGEDHYTMLAYRALIQLEHVAKLNLDLVSALPPKPFYIDSRSDDK